jgi:transposase
LWYRARTADSRIGRRETMIVALARKLVIALWRFVTTGEPLEGVILRPTGVVRLTYREQKSPKQDA